MTIKDDGKVVNSGDYPDSVFSKKSQEPFPKEQSEDSKAYFELAAKERNLINGIAKQAYGQNVTGSMIDTGDVAIQQLKKAAGAARLEQDR